ncbi:hypothetical protein NQ318_023598 [Aromia moschata]|uniref:Mutator-like transposase domain-containing protein n=1 Tax=Aromia moschata TaxID=1265417 RepID=A0AAV8YRN9_9CUCU|nr:hypothetical protein NQ318_023598 [Aromia moschata]
MLSATDIARDRLLHKSVEEENQKTLEANNSDELDGLTVSGDGSWRKRGFNSLYGVSAIIGHYSGQVGDLLVKSSYCKACESWKSKFDTEEYAEWFETHAENCSSNHDATVRREKRRRMRCWKCSSDRNQSTE